ncbi:MAG TPA: hypothetical protein VF916_16050 [Ktedonobacterales bacterium]
MGAQYDAESWRVELAHIVAQLDELKARSDEEYRVLHAVLDAQIEDLQAALRKLETQVDAVCPDAFAKKVAEQIEELKAKGDAAYDRLQARMPGPVDQRPPHP